MKRKFCCLTFFVLSATLLASVFAQAPTNFWQDGNPFLKTYPVMTNISFDPARELISLQSIDSLAAEPAGIHFFLNGINWRWPLNPMNEATIIQSAEDIELFTSGGVALYAVADATGQKVVVSRVSDGFINDTFKDNTGPLHLGRPVDVETFIETTDLKLLITDQTRHRVIKVDYINKDVKNVYGIDDMIGIGNGRLNNPTDAVKIPGLPQYLICDQGNKRVIWVEESGNILWNWGMSAGQTLNLPEDVEYISSRNEVLITDKGDQRVIIVDVARDTIVWDYRTGLKDPVDADTLANGNILIADAGNNRIIEVSRATKQIVWDYSQGIKSLKEADRIEGRTDFVEYNDHTLIIIEDSSTGYNIPFRVGYESNVVTSTPRNIHHQANFDELIFTRNILAGVTSARIQLRTGKSEDGVQAAQWLGPTSSVDAYTVSNTPINTTHDGDSWYQFRIFLDTNSKLYTPIVSNLGVRFHYYRNENSGILKSEVIGEAPGRVITKWNQLQVKTKLPENKSADLNQLSLVIKLRNVAGDSLYVFSAGQAEQNVFDLTSISRLQDVQKLQLELLFNSTNSAYSPVLDAIRLDWDYEETAPARVMFIDLESDSTSLYRVRRKLDDVTADKIVLKLIDTNIIPVRQKVTVPVLAVKSGDKVDMELTYSSFLGYYKSDMINAITVTELNQVDINNKEFEVFDRDTLVANYTDPTDPSDKATARVTIFKNTRGDLKVENASGTVYIDRASFGDVLFAHVTGETDQDLTAAQDSIQIEYKNNINDDIEFLWAYEIKNRVTDLYDTGEFMTATGLEIKASRIADSLNNIIEALRGHTITVSFYDNDILSKNIQVPDSFIIFEAGLFEAQLAPNPFYESKHEQLKLRVISSEGDVTLGQLEIFNFAGQRLLEIDGSALAFDLAQPFPSGQPAVCTYWWDLKNLSGDLVSSGTYFLKISGSVIDPITQSVQKVNRLVKFVIIR